MFGIKGPFFRKMFYGFQAFERQLLVWVKFDLDFGGLV